MTSATQFSFFPQLFFRLGNQRKLTCEIEVGDEENIKILWFNSRQSGIIARTRELILSNIELSDSDPSYMAEYWCFANNSDGIGRSQNVTVHIVSEGKQPLSLLHL